MEIDGVSSETLVSLLTKQGVLVSSTDSSYIDGFRHPEGLRLCICNVDDAGIRQAVDCIGRELKYTGQRANYYGRLKGGGFLWMR
jgi:DNA-binding transcriptional MocR family regulator